MLARSLGAHWRAVGMAMLPEAPEEGISAMFNPLLLSVIGLVPMILLAIAVTVRPMAGNRAV
jgi:hypothetical protein